MSAESRAEYMRKWRANNRERIREYKRANPDKRSSERARKWRMQNRGRDLENARKWCAENLEKSREIKRNWARKPENKVKKNESRQKWRLANKSEAKQFVERYHSDIEYNICIKIRRRIYMALRNAFNKNARNHTKNRTIDLLGCSYETLKSHIESQFMEGMTWDKMFSGDIHFDHIRPCSSFNLTDPEEQKKCFNYINLQPLWWWENLAKGDKIAA